MKRKPVVDRFWDSVGQKNPSGCMEWLGEIINKGYGRLYRTKQQGGRIFAHRFSYELHYGKIPDGKLVMHKCDNPKCVNPDHLAIGSYTDNNRDCVAKGRYRPFWEKVSEKDVSDMKNLFQSGLSKAEIAREYGVSRTLVYLYVTGKYKPPVHSSNINMI